MNGFFSVSFENSIKLFKPSNNQFISLNEEKIGYLPILSSNNIKEDYLFNDNSINFNILNGRSNQIYLIMFPFLIFENNQEIIKSITTLNYKIDTNERFNDRFNNSNCNLLIRILNNFNINQNHYLKRREVKLTYSNIESEEFKLYYNSYGSSKVNPFILTDEISECTSKIELINYLKPFYPIVIYEPIKLLKYSSNNSKTITSRNTSSIFKLFHLDFITINNDIFKSIIDFDSISIIKKHLEDNFDNFYSNLLLFKSIKSRNEIDKYMLQILYSIFDYLKEIHPIYFMEEDSDSRIKKVSLALKLYNHFLVTLIKMIEERFNENSTINNNQNTKENINLLKYELLISISTFLIIMDYDYIIRYQIKEDFKLKDDFDKENYNYHRIDERFFNYNLGFSMVSIKNSKEKNFINSFNHFIFSKQPFFLKGYSNIFIFSNEIINRSNDNKLDLERFYSICFKKLKINCDIMFISSSSNSLVYYRKDNNLNPVIVGKLTTNFK